MSDTPLNAAALVTAQEIIRDMLTMPHIIRSRKAPESTPVIQLWPESGPGFRVSVVLMPKRTPFTREDEQTLMTVLKDNVAEKMAAFLHANYTRAKPMSLF